MTSPASLRAAQHRSFGHLLLTCARLFDEAAQAQLNATTGDRLGRPAVMRLIPHLDTVGIRPTQLARRVDISKQAVGQVLAELEARGLVDYTPDPADGRARLVRLTKAGVQASVLGLGVLADLERRVTRRVGRARMREVHAGLEAILDAVQALRTAER
jgi:DNA-binding MarR family transcriptional regulator